jgi:chorismate mutase
MPELTKELQAGGTGAPPSSGALAELLHADERPGRAELRRQIARLEAELGELFTSSFPRAGIAYGVAAAGGPRLLGIAELESVRDQLLSRIADVKSILGERGFVEDRNRELLERVIAEPEKYHWVRISNEDIGEPGCRHYHSRPRFGLIGMLMGWWRVKLSSGCPLAKGAARPGSSNG